MYTKYSRQESDRQVEIKSFNTYHKTDKRRIAYTLESSESLCKPDHYVYTLHCNTTNLDLKLAN